CISGAYYAGRWLRAVGVPCVGVIHSDDPFYTRGILDRFVNGQAQDWMTAFVCVSAATHELFASSVRGRGPVEYIPYGVSVPQSDQMAGWRCEGQRFRVIYAGRIVEEQKRVTAVARSLCRLAKEIPGLDGVMYGSGAQEGEVERILASHGNGAVRLA